MIPNVVPDLAGFAQRNNPIVAIGSQPPRDRSAVPTSVPRRKPKQARKRTHQDMEEEEEEEEAAPDTAPEELSEYEMLRLAK